MSDNASFTLRLVGYRAFRDSGEFRLSPGRTAFIGVNNAGKSSILRSLYETKQVFETLAAVSAAPGHGVMQDILRHQSVPRLSLNLRPGERVEGRFGQLPEIHIGLPASTYGDDDVIWPKRCSLSFPGGRAGILRLWVEGGELPTGPEHVWNGALNVRADAPNAPIYRLAGTDVHVDVTPLHLVAAQLSKCFYVGAFPECTQSRKSRGLL